MSRIFMEAHSTSEFKTENRNGCTGKEETRCKGGASPQREKEQTQATSRKTVHHTVLSQEGTGGRACMPGDKTACFNDTGYACPPDTRSCKTVIKASLLTAPSVSKFLLSVWASGLYFPQKLLMVKSISKLYVSISLSFSHSHTSHTHCHLPFSKGWS